MEKGLIHLYHGDGKGKTTAAIGLSVRALGRGKRVVVVQFLKSGDSGELEPLRRMGATVYSGKTDGEAMKFSFQMDEQERNAAKALHDGYLKNAVAIAPDLLVLDECCAALSTGLLSEKLLRNSIINRPEGQEVVLTGRNPPQWLMDMADYCTEMLCIRHPYEAGIAAREGIEY